MVKLGGGHVLSIMELKMICVFREIDEDRDVDDGCVEFWV
jgi:hypothetical protein